MWHLSFMLSRMKMYCHVKVFSRLEPNISASVETNKKQTWLNTVQFPWRLVRTKRKLQFKASKLLGFCLEEKKLSYIFSTLSVSMHFTLYRIYAVFFLQFLRFFPLLFLRILYFKVSRLTDSTQSNFLKVISVFYFRGQKISLKPS